jgi:very-short-patch-repair endonuclease
VVAYWQLRELGFSKGEIRGLRAASHLHRIHRGVYAVGHVRLTRKGRWMAAVLACGPEAILSHRAAAALWELRPPPSGPVDVTVPGRTRKGTPGIRVHNVRTLHADDGAIVDGIPVTSVHRTLLDYGEVAWFQQLRHAVDAAERRELLDGRKLEALYARSRGRHGLKPLREAVAKLSGPAPWTQSELERTMLALVRGRGLPEPLTNRLVEGELVDFLWADRRLILEVDSYLFHKSRERFEADRRRDAKLMLAGYRVLRITQERLESEPQQVLRELIALLGDAPGAAAAGP